MGQANAAPEGPLFHPFSFSVHLFQFLLEMGLKIFQFNRANESSLLKTFFAT
jgi:hypothetical protein